MTDEHGTATGYRRGCRCDRCRCAKAVDRTGPHRPRRLNTEEAIDVLLEILHPIEGL